MISKAGDTSANAHQPRPGLPLKGQVNKHRRLNHPLVSQEFPLWTSTYGYMIQSIIEAFLESCKSQSPQSQQGDSKETSPKDKLLLLSRGFVVCDVEVGCFSIQMCLSY